MKETKSNSLRAEETTDREEEKERQDSKHTYANHDSLYLHCLLQPDVHHDFNQNGPDTALHRNEPYVPKSDQ